MVVFLNVLTAFKLLNVLFIYLQFVYLKIMNELVFI